MEDEEGELEFDTYEEDGLIPFELDGEEGEVDMDDVYDEEEEGEMDDDDLMGADDGAVLGDGKSQMEAMEELRKQLNKDLAKKEKKDKKDKKEKKKEEGDDEDA